jgi:oligoribonuclease NrnB/cAMP/cGMP phosphodiesterase (DHH superfamily)
MKTYVLYHKDCLDGFGSAYAAWKTLKGTAEYIPVSYSDPIPTMDQGSTIYILDFSYSKVVLESLSKDMEKIVVIDHHYTSFEALKDVSGIETVFSMENSGAILSWQYFHKGDPAPEFLRYIEDRDLWKFTLPLCAEVTMAITSYPKDFEVWDNSLSIENLKIEGATIKRYRDPLVERLCLSAKKIRIQNHEIPAVNAMCFQSEVCHRLAELYPSAKFTACFYLGQDDQTFWSLRSSNGFDVSEIAKKYGGGGHKAASGFCLDSLNISKSF